MKKYIFYIILSFLITTSVSARKTGCEGDCENGFGKWTYTDKTTYEGNWVGTQKHGQGIEIWPILLHKLHHLERLKFLDRSTHYF